MSSFSFRFLGTTFVEIKGEETRRDGQFSYI